MIISAEELDALKEAANAQADAPEAEEIVIQKPKAKPMSIGLEDGMAKMNLNDKKKQISESLMQS